MQYYGDKTLYYKKKKKKIAEDHQHHNSPWVNRCVLSESVKSAIWTGNWPKESKRMKII